jgi:GT2 family glycosyltransferase
MIKKTSPSGGGSFRRCDAMQEARAIRVSVIIATYGRDDELKRAIESVLSQDFDGFELLVVDQTTHHSAAIRSYLEDQADRRFQYFLVAPPSLPAARNFGLERARGEVVVYVDDDVELKPDFIAGHYRTYAEDNLIGAVAGKVMTPGEPKTTTLLHITRAGLNRGGLDYDRDSWITTTQGCNMSFRADALRAIGGFDTAYIGNAYREESDACYRLRRLGYKIAFRPSAALTHFRAKTGGAVGNRDRILDQPAIYRNETLFFLRYQPKLLLPYFLARQLRQAVLRRSVLTGKSRGRTAAFVRGFIAGVRAYRRPSQIVARPITSSKGSPIGRHELGDQSSRLLDEPSA